MKTMLKTTLMLALPLLLAAAAGAQTGPASNRVATIDMKKVFDRYYKRDQARKAFEKEAADMEKELKNMATDAAKAQDEYKKLKDAQDDTMISDSERAARKAKADAKQDEVKSYQADLASYEQQAKDKLSIDQSHMTDLLVQDIQNAINAKARTAGYFLVVDTSAVGVNGPVVLFSSGENDITEEILKQLNAAAPPPPSDSPTNTVNASAVRQ